MEESRGDKAGEVGRETDQAGPQHTIDDKEFHGRLLGRVHSKSWFTFFQILLVWGGSEDWRDPLGRRDGRMASWGHHALLFPLSPNL